MALQLLYKTFRLYLSIAAGFFTLFLSPSTFAANTIEIEQRFLQLENAEMIATMEENRQSFNDEKVLVNWKEASGEDTVYLINN